MTFVSSICLKKVRPMQDAAGLKGKKQIPNQQA